MNSKISTRLQVLLGKIAGRNVDLSTMTPPVAASVEEMLLGEIAGRIDTVAASAESIKPKITVTKIWEATVNTESGQDAFGGSAKLIDNKSMRHYIAGGRSNAQIAADGVDTLSKVLDFRIVIRQGNAQNDTWYNTSFNGSNGTNVRINGIADPVVEPLQTLDVDTLYYEGSCNSMGAKKFKIEVYLVCAN